MQMTLEDFVRESNRIEGIHRDPTSEEIAAHKIFLSLTNPTIEDMCAFVKVCAPHAELRNKEGMDVRVGNYIPPRGGPDIEIKLNEILKHWPWMSSFLLHVQYEKLHPFTDCNGRSGRVLWLWRHRDYSLGFLHAFYYQTLSTISDRI